MDEATTKLKPSQLQLSREPVDVNAFRKAVKQQYDNLGEVTEDAPSGVGQFFLEEVSAEHPYNERHSCFLYVYPRFLAAVKSGLLVSGNHISEFFQDVFSVEQLAELEAIVKIFEQRKPKVYGEPVLGASIMDVAPATEMGEVSPIFADVPNPPRVFLESNEKKEKLLQDLMVAANEAKGKGV